MLTSRLPAANDNWHRIWQVQRWDEYNLSELKSIFSALPQKTIVECPELADLKDAIQTSVANNLTLETELIPSGNSDGIKWTLAAHCHICKFESTDATKVCIQCGQPNTWVPAASRKVLGLRPYMVLQNIIGLEDTEQLLQTYHQEKADCDSNGHQ